MDVREKFRFAAFEIDLQAHELLRNGRAVRVAPQALRLLEFLVSHPGRLVTREEIRKEIWSDTTFVDFEQGINKSVRQIRDALNDDADKPRFVETLPRRGYRFIAKVEYPETEHVEAPMDEPNRAAPTSFTAETAELAESRPRILTRRWVLFGVAALVLVVAAFQLGLRLERGPRASPPQPVIQSIVVLPFANLSTDSSQDYFAAGITEELTTNLANTGAVRVISHTSASRIQSGGKSLSQIALELKVDGVVEGAVQRSADRVRITVQLIRAATDEHIWAATYDREAKDVLGVEEDVARAIAGAIQVKLTEAQQKRTPSGRRPVDPAAYDAYLKGRYAWNARQTASLERALDFFQRAVDIDPTFAEGYAGLADTYALLGIAGFDGMPVSEAMENARAAATKALALDNNLSEGHTSLAYVSATYDWNWELAEREYRRALQLNPNNATAHQWYSALLCVLGRWDQSIAEAKAAQSLDPLSAIVQENLAYPYYYSRRYDEAIEVSKSTLASHPDFAISHLRLGREYAAKNVYTEAAEQFQRFSELMGGGNTLALASLANLRARSGGQAAAERLLARLRFAARQKHVPAYQFAIVYSGMGNADEAMKWLEKAYEERSGFLLYMRNETLFDGLRADPRFVELERRIGI